MTVSVPVVTSWMSSAALWQPSTSRWVQVESSLAESTLNTWVSTPCLVPERRPKESSESRRGELFPGPEWTSLGVEWEEGNERLEWEEGYEREGRWGLETWRGQDRENETYGRRERVREKENYGNVKRRRTREKESSREGDKVGRKNAWLISSGSTNHFQMNMMLWGKMSNSTVMETVSICSFTGPKQVWESVWHCVC